MPYPRPNSRPNPRPPALAAAALPALAAVNGVAQAPAVAEVGAVAGIRIIGHLGLDFDRQAADAAAHIGDAGGQPHSRAGVQADHALRLSARLDNDKLARVRWSG